MGKTSIEWCTAVWNPLRGCTRVSPGCVNCYAEVMAARFSGPGYWGEGVAEIVQKPGGGIDHRWTGKIVEVADKLLEPMRWKKPQRIFVNSTSDLFHEGVSDDFIEQIFAVMALCPQHTFLVLTKRADRMSRFFAGFEEDGVFHEGCRDALIEGQAQSLYAKQHPDEAANVSMWLAVHMPLPNVWIGISTEDQQRFDERWPHLAATPAAKRFISYEPALGPVDFGAAMFGPIRVDQIIIGGESGPGARVFDPAWARSALAQCRVRGVAAFVKQMGSRPYDSGNPSAAAAGGPIKMRLVDKKGGDMAEWPEELRVREMP
jgi:protein gp37